MYPEQKDWSFCCRDEKQQYLNNIQFWTSTSCCITTMLTTVHFLSSPCFCGLFWFCFSKSRLCKSEVNIYVIKTVFGMYLKLIAEPETLNISLATIDLSCWSKKSTCIIHKCSHWTTEDSLLCCQVLQCSKTTLFLLLYRCATADKKNCTKRSANTESLAGNVWAKWIFNQQKTQHVFTLYCELLPTQFSLCLNHWITRNWGNKYHKVKQSLCQSRSKHTEVNPGWLSPSSYMQRCIDALAHKTSLACNRNSPTWGVWGVYFVCVLKSGATRTYHSTIPSPTALNRSSVFGFIGITCLQSGSFSRALFIQFTKAYFSSSAI